MNLQLHKRSFWKDSKGRQQEGDCERNLMGQKTNRRGVRGGGVLCGIQNGLLQHKQL